MHSEASPAKTAAGVRPPPLSLTAHYGEGWQGAGLQVTVRLIGSKCFSTEEVFPPQRSYKEPFQRKEGRQSVWPPCSLPCVALYEARALFLSSIGQCQRWAETCEALSLCLHHIRTFLKFRGGGVIVKPCFLSVAPGTQQLVGLLCSLLMDLYQNLFIFWPPSNPTPSSYMRLLSLCLFFSYQSLFLLNPKLNPWSYILH